MTSTFSPCSCTTALSPDEYDDYTKYTLSTGKSHGSGSSDESDVLNTSYRAATPLFREIEKENWAGVHLFLTQGKWATSFLRSSNEHLKSPSAALQVKTWVTSYDRHDIPEWSQLPLHAALSYNAPFVIIQKLIEMYPKSIQCTDNEGMLPIHLAYGFGASDAVLEMLLEPFPASVNEKGLGGRYPYESCELGPNKSRGEVYRIVADQITKRVRNEVDEEWRESFAIAKKSLGLESLDVSNVQLKDLLYDLMKENKELRGFKKAVENEDLVSISSSTRRARRSYNYDTRAMKSPSRDHSRKGTASANESVESASVPSRTWPKKLSGNGKKGKNRFNWKKE